MFRLPGDPIAQALYRVIDVPAVGEYLAHRRAGHQPALGATVTLAGLHVVRVEEERITGIRADVVAIEVGQHKRLEKPAGVRQVPLRGTDVRHGADDVVLDLQWGAEADRLFTNRSVAVSETLLLAFREYCGYGHAASLANVDGRWPAGPEAQRIRGSHWTSDLIRPSQSNSRNRRTVPEIGTPQPTISWHPN